MINLPLQKQLILHIFASIGFKFSESTFFAGYFARTGLSVTIQDQDGEASSPILSGEWGLATSTIRCMMTRLAASSVVGGESPTSPEEFFFIVQMDDLPIYGLRLSADEDDWGNFCHHQTNSGWVPTPTFIQLSVSTGMERMFQAAPVCREPSDIEVKRLHRTFQSFIQYCDGIESES